MGVCAVVSETVTLSAILPRGRIGDILSNISVGDFVKLLLERERYDVFHRFLDELLDSGRIDRETYARVSSMVVDLMWKKDDKIRKQTIGRILEELSSGIRLVNQREFTAREALIEERYDVFHRFLDELLDSGRIDRETYARVSSMVVDLMWTNDEDKKSELIDRIVMLISQ